MVYKRGTPEYDLWKETPAYDLWRARISVANKGKHHSIETRANMSIARSGERHPFYGKHHSVDALAKMSAAQSSEHRSVETCAKMGRPMNGKRNPMYGKHHSAETLAKMHAAQSGKHHNAETLAKMGMARTGERNPNWHGGISFEPYPVGWTTHLRDEIRKRDNYTCALCGKPQNKRRHSVHHINYDKEDLRPENLVTLCRPCHRKTNYDREYWKNLFNMIYVSDFPKKENKK